VSATSAHPSAGVTCVGARPILLAWNVFVTGIDLDQARRIATLIRERDGGFPGLRALGLRLPDQDRVQISMNLEDPERTSPLDVFDRIASEVEGMGGEVVETEVIGMMPDTLVLPDSADRLMLPDLGPSRVLSHRVSDYVAARAGGRTETSEVTK
jgi:glutamate formiminotransferase